MLKLTKNPPIFGGLFVLFCFVTVYFCVWPPAEAPKGSLSSGRIFNFCFYGI